MAERWEPTLGDTLPSSIRLLSLVEDDEGFRVLLQDPKSFYVYGVYADAVFCRRCQECTGFGDSPQLIKSKALMFRVYESELVKWLRPSLIHIEQPLEHYALCWEF